MLNYNFFERFNWPKEGFCRICGKNGKLTEDHVPPSSCFNSEAKIVYDFPRVKKVNSNSGVKYRSICSDCNNTVLGKYDAELARLALNTAQYIHTRIVGKIQLPTFECIIQPAAIFRSILGHMIASYCLPKDISLPVESVKGSYFHALRDLFHNRSKQSRRHFKLYYWIHSGDKITNIPFFTHSDIRYSGNVFHGSLLRFYPMAFWLVEHSDAPSARLTLPYLALSDSLGDIQIDLNEIPHLSPEFPFGSSHSFSLLDTDSLVQARNKQSSIIRTFKK
ncbi:hypothetical protein [Leptospira saintgironsiae]|uniref:HNH endonuclease 5 domain-containing protein n=1 Tax=Leptospira saintgironsiae TaxID=2023183 RepID=A0A2M9Y7D5_9LEPT|nr:hypothetical protein [Leptospira saintgironsiae]PJZ47467.1 hypothetical protein CH362_19055 [Leptospira saintgironsiae]